MTSIINFFGGPGAGKSTTAAGLFSLMKQQGISCELAHETAKIFTWEERKKALACQPYIFGKQLMQIERLVGQVDFVISDSPLLLSAHYSAKYYPESWINAVKDIYNNFDNINFLLMREKEYVPIGRNQTKEEAIVIDQDITQMLRNDGQYWKVVTGAFHPGKTQVEMAYWHLQDEAQARGCPIPRLFA
jgi:tRNA uridine 5-carbamoylmethylation protein Kti12